MGLSEKTKNDVVEQSMMKLPYKILEKVMVKNDEVYLFDVPNEPPVWLWDAQLVEKNGEIFTSRRYFENQLANARERKNQVRKI